MKTETKKPRVYKRIDRKTVANFKAAVAEHGNGSAAVRALEDSRLSPKDRAFRITKKSEQQTTSDFIDDQMQQIGVDAIKRIGKMVNSSDERIASKNAQYIVDHIRGQATKKSIALTGKIGIQDVL